jgi:hypothetical protein
MAVSKKWRALIAAVFIAAAAAPLCAQISSPFDEALAKEIEKDDKDTEAAPKRQYDPRTETVLDIVLVSVGIVIAGIVIVILRKAKKRRHAEVRVVKLCRICRRQDSEESPLALTECTMCDPPALYCESHIHDHIHRK